MPLIHQDSSGNLAGQHYISTPVTGKQNEEVIMISETILKVTDLKMVYPDGTQALKGISTTVKKGEFLCIIGSSGAGKSTFLRCINRLVEPTSGSIVFNNVEVTKANARELRNIRRQVGMVFQGYNLIKRSPTVTNVLHGRLGYMSTLKGGLGLFSKEDTQKALAMLARVGLEDQAFKRADELSGGQAQRVGIARAFCQEPLMLLADEPIASLDPAASKSIMSYMKKISEEEGITSIVNLHQVDFARDYATRIIAINAGEIVFEGTPSELTDEVTEGIFTRR